MGRYRAIYDKEGLLVEYENGELKWAADRYYYQGEKNQTHAIITDMQPWDAYESPVSGKVITSKKQRMEDMARANCRPYEGFEQESKEAARAKQYEDARNERQLDSAVRTAWYQMDPRKRRALMNN